MKFGEYEVFLLEDGEFRLDGGAMFGVVPRVMWSKTDAPDDRNRIRLAANCLLIKGDGFNALIDTGLGGKWEDKERDMFAVAEPRTLITDLARVDLHPDDITHVIQTHLHFDHVGGATFIDAEGELKVQFPNARLYAQRGEWEIGSDPNPRDKRSYKPENLRPLEEAGVLELIDGDGEVLPGISVHVTGGHTKHHQIVRITSNGHRITYLGDLIPTPSHLPVPFVMAYDLFPQQTMEAKAPLLEQMHDEGDLLVFEHGANAKAGHLKKNDRGRMELLPFDMDQTEYAAPAN
jgi:glyoxylase-like metal-dependent hydrolase (beta-lactamase superfamily II)